MGKKDIKTLEENNEIELDKKIFEEENNEIIENFNNLYKRILKLIIDLNKFNVKIMDEPWYKNYIDIYIPMLKAYASEEKTFDNLNENWLRVYIKAFFSDVEKSTKWFIEQLYSNKKYYKNFYESIKYLCSPFYDYPILPNNFFKREYGWDLKTTLEQEISCGKKVTINLELWRKVYNQLKHENTEETTVLIDEQNKLLAHFDSDFLPCISLHSQNIYFFLKVLVRIKSEKTFKIKEKPSYSFDIKKFNYL